MTPSGSNRNILTALSCFLMIGFLITAGSFKSHAQLTVTQGTSGDQLAQYLAGPGVVISNVVLNCGDSAYGFFNGVNSNLGIDSGIVMSTGMISAIPGPNDWNISGWTDGPSIPYLTQLSGYQTYDGCELEFDVDVTADTLVFTYVFGSDEYSEYVGSQVFNDIFAFFLTGPNPSGGTYNDINLALVPNTSTPVSINNVNCVTPSFPEYYICNDPFNSTGWMTYCGAQNPCPSDAASTTVDFDGFTVPLIAKIPVSPCNTYHLKLAIADCSDSALDSGVFIEAGSLTSYGVQIIPTATYINPLTNTPAAVEGCVDAQVRVRLSFLPVDTVFIPLQIGGTATFGVDYNYVGYTSDTIMFLPGDSVEFIDIEAVADGFPDPMETIEFIYQPQFCAGAYYDTVVLYITDFMEAIASPDDTICFGSPAQLSVNGGTSISYNWTPSTGLSCTDCQMPFADPPVTTTYTVVISASAACTASDEVVITTVNPSAELGADVNVCEGDSVQLYATPTLVQGLTYEWTPTTGLACSSCFSTKASPAVTTTYYVHTFADTCHAYDSVVVNVVTPIANAGPDLNLCYGDSIDLTTTPQAGQTYLWEPFVNSTCPTCEATSVFPDTTTTYTITASLGSCFVQDEVIVNVTRVYPNAGPDVGICPWDTTTLVGSGGATYSWQPALGLNTTVTDSVLATPAATTTYIVTVSSSGFICSANDTVIVTVYDPPTAVASPDTTICFETEAFLSGSGGDVYLWYPIDVLTNPSGQTTFAHPFDTTTFALVVEDGNGCKDTAFTTVNVYPEPYMPISGPHFIYYGESVQLQTGGGVMYQWTPDSTLSSGTSDAPVAQPSYTTTYTVLITTENGCVYSREAVVVVDRTSEVWVPNAFSPNGDGMNDDLRIIVRGVFTMQSFQVFNRWGELVYETNDPDLGWDGMFEGSPAELGVYVYQVRGTDISNSTILKSGNVLLLR